MTNEAEKAFVIVYAEYLRRRRYGTSLEEAARFPSEKLTAISEFSNWNPADIRYCMNELKECGFVKIDILGEVKLTKDGIKFMQSRPKEYFAAIAGIAKEVLELILAAIPPC